MHAMEWFRKAGFGLMIHWGCTFARRRMERQRMEGIGEWIQSRFRIPQKEYATLASVFNPFFDGGMVLLAKQAVCSIWSLLNTMTVLPCTPPVDSTMVDAALGRDVIGELAAACQSWG